MAMKMSSMNIVEPVDINITIKAENGHYVGLVGGKTYCTGDTYSEVEKEIYNDLQNGLIFA